MGSDPVNRLRKMKRLKLIILLRDPAGFHTHPSRNRIPNPHD